MEEHNITTVSIPKILAEKVKKRIENTGFNSISSYITYVLRQIMSESEDSKKKENPFSKEDEIKVKERLRSLGYLD